MPSPAGVVWSPRLVGPIQSARPRGHCGRCGKLFPLFPPPYGARGGASVEIEEGFSKELGQTKDWMYLL